MKKTVCTLSALVLSAGAAAAQPEQQETVVLPDFKTILGMADQNEDGVVTRAEFIEARASFFPKLDRDGSGNLSKDEFVNGASDAIGGSRRARRAFDRLDADGDGKMTLEEWNAMPTRAFDNADKNKDGQLTSDEIEKV